MVPLFVREIVKQLPDAGILRTPRGFLIEAARLELNGAGLPSHRLEPKGTHQPNRLALHEAAHVLAANERDMFSEFLLVQLDKPPTVPRFFLPHPVANRGRGRER